jgi:hydroxyacylglutathione hydrolase
MIVERIWTANSWRSFNYVIACPETGEALAVDPLDHERCLALARDRGWDITQVLNTHEHYDHTAGNGPVIRATGARLLAHANAKPNLPRMDRALGAGDVVKVGRSVEFECLDTPGHTLAHVCLLAHADPPALICGDTLFNSGAGNCHNGGHPERLYETFATQLEKLPDSTLVYPGHDYMVRNLQFTLAREPDNERAERLIAEVRDHDGAEAPVTTLAIEKDVNTFFRLRSPTVIRKLREVFPELPEQPSPRSVFLALRELRDHW